MSSKEYFYNWLINRKISVDKTFFDVFYSEHKEYINKNLTKFSSYWFHNWKRLEKFYCKCQSEYLQFKINSVLY